MFSPAIPAFHKGHHLAFLLFGLAHLERKSRREESGAMAGASGKEMQLKVFGIRVFSHGLLIIPVNSSQLIPGSGNCIINSQCVQPQREFLFFS